ncbi:hypothetical protein V2A60_000126 [Cordyceps javanica]
MLATSTNVKLILQDGVDGNSIHEKARPKGSESLRPEQLGCWRSHANVWRRIIDERIQTAIILEDDADWDVKVHDAFQALSFQMRKWTAEKGNTSREATRAPYGLDWDLLYVGTCWNINAEVRPPSHIYEDLTAPNSTEMAFSYQEELKYWGATSLNADRVRVIAPSWYPVCTIGIQSGHLKSLTVVPPLVTTWKTGSVSDSDIDNLAEVEGELPRGSKNLRYSGRRALASTLNAGGGK